MSINDRVRRLEDNYGGGKPDAHPDYLRDQAILVGIHDCGPRTDLPQDVAEALSRQDLRRRLIQFGVMAQEEVHQIDNAGLWDTYCGNRGCLGRLWECCLGSVAVEGPNRHAVIGAQMIVQCYQEHRQLGECPPEIVAMAKTEVG